MTTATIRCPQASDYVGEAYSSISCTLGFHIRRGTDEQIVTAGHCGYGGNFTWYHAGFGQVGPELVSQYSSGGRDAMTVQVADAQASDNIYNDSQNITGASNPVTGMVICASLGWTDAIQCGTVTIANTSWTGTHCGCIIFGADAGSIFPVEGDSGSPLYVVDNNEFAIGYGIMNTASGKFARLADVLSVWSATIVA